MPDIYRDGAVRRPVLELRPGDRVDLQDDPIADPTVDDHPEFEFEFQEVYEVERETLDCVRVDFASGFSCGFPIDHLVDVDGEQVR